MLIWLLILNVGNGHDNKSILAKMYLRHALQLIAAYRKYPLVGQDVVESVYHSVFNGIVLSILL